jgi:enterochelin esterase-like enzyme
VLAALAALAGVVGLAVLCPPSGARRRLLGRGAAVLVLALLAQGFAVLAAGLVINDQYDFYASWGDLAGQGAATGPIIHLGGLTTHGQGRLVLRTIATHHGGRDDRVIMWLPAQYDQPAYRQHRFPVLMFLPGQPSSPAVVFHQFDFAHVATAAISNGVPPFIAVFPTIMIDPPRDTECTDVPHGPRAESWLTRVVPRYVTSHFRAAPTGPDWTVMGWSTGGFCAAKLLLGHQHEFGSAASFGGYYRPVEDHTTGSLFAGSILREEHNSPTWLMRSERLLHDRLLVVTSKQDRESWPETARFLRFAGTDPHVSYLAPARGGHNYRVYRRLLPSALRWAGQGWTGSNPGRGLRTG